MAYRVFAIGEGDASLTIFSIIMDDIFRETAWQGGL